jgi:hypothetical protein
VSWSSLFTGVSQNLTTNIFERYFDTTNKPRKRKSANTNKHQQTPTNTNKHQQTPTNTNKHQQTPHRLVTMIFRHFLTSFTICLVWFVPTVLAIGTDYITTGTAPMTVYDSTEITPQTLDYDKTNKMFPAHDCWLNDKIAHYYKFRVYAPPTYPGLITMDSTAADVPLQKIYLMTTDGTMDGVVGKPILEYHHIDGLNYSDFMEIVLVQASSFYAADTYKSAGDVKDSTMTKNMTGIILNIPLVPNNATLAAAIDKNDGMTSTTRSTSKPLAPIKPVLAWYKGVEVWTYVFEVTHAKAAEYFAYTRDDPTDTSYGITVVSTYATSTYVSAIPLVHMNQYTAGVTSKNFGGPSDVGMRNIINLDRPDAGYSPLWRIDWATMLPIGYSADQVSNMLDLTKANGFQYIQLPIYINCPNIGSVGTAINSAKLSKFQTTIDMSKEYNMILGSDKSLVLMPNVTVDFMSMNKIIGTTQTLMLGSYQYNLASEKIPAGAMSVEVYVNGTMIRSINVTNSVGAGTGNKSAGGRHTGITSLLVAVILTVVALIV